MYSANDTSGKAIPRQSLDYISTAILRIIHAIATLATETLCIFVKFDIKDSF